ncbi:hypothetical protein [Legionella saoudiensis]|uniref:hypothetical protein n=1 Tax=Legionella saoudiensis TaxID=1750561 RepID=UPI000730185B|nr:hypothetical protein [Legionella saoudiensis]
MDINVKNNHYLSILIAIGFIISLTYYLGYLYGLGLDPKVIPLSISDIINGMITFLPINLVIFLIIYWFGIPELDVDQNNHKDSASSSKSSNCGAMVLFILLFIVISWNAFFGTRIWSYLLCWALFYMAIQALNPPSFFPKMHAEILKFILLVLATFFSIGFINGFWAFYSPKKSNVIVTLTDNSRYEGMILSYLTSGSVVKIENQILFINNANIKSIKYQPSMSYSEAKKINQ